MYTIYKALETHTHTHTHTHTRTHTHAYTHTHTHTHTHIYIYIYIHTYIGIYTHTYAYSLLMHLRSIWRYHKKWTNWRLIIQRSSVYINIRQLVFLSLSSRHNVSNDANWHCLFIYLLFPLVQPVKISSKFFPLSTPYRFSLSATCFAVVHSHTFKDSPWEIIRNHNFAGYARSALIKSWTGVCSWYKWGAIGLSV